MTFISQRVLDSRRHLGEALTLDDVRFFESLQSFRKRLGTDAIERALEFAEPTLTLREVPHDEWGPLVTNDLSRTRDRTTEGPRRIGWGILVLSVRCWCGVCRCHSDHLANTGPRVENQYWRHVPPDEDAQDLGSVASSFLKGSTRTHLTVG